MHGNVRYPKLHDPVWLREHLKTETPGRIAEQLGASRPTVMHAIKKHKLEYIPRARESRWARSRVYKPKFGYDETQIRLVIAMFKMIESAYDPDDIPWEMLELEGINKDWLWFQSNQNG